MSSEDKLVAALYRACANTKYAIDALSLQSITRNKAEQLGGDWQFLCRFWSMMPEQKDKATEAVIVYNDALTLFLPNLIPNREKIAHLITETLAKVDELIVDIVNNPDQPASLLDAGSLFVSETPFAPDPPPAKIDRRRKEHRLTNNQTQQ